MDLNKHICVYPGCQNEALGGYFYCHEHRKGREHRSFKQDEVPEKKPEFKTVTTLCCISNKCRAKKDLTPEEYQQWANAGKVFCIECGKIMTYHHETKVQVN